MSLKNCHGFLGKKKERTLCHTHTHAHAHHTEHNETINISNMLNAFIKKIEYFLWSPSNSFALHKTFDDYKRRFSIFISVYMYAHACVCLRLTKIFRDFCCSCNKLFNVNMFIHLPICLCHLFSTVMESLAWVSSPMLYGTHLMARVFDARMSIDLCALKSFAPRTFPEWLE